jgi:uncharacterized protein (TIGR03435 family)
MMSQYLSALANHLWQSTLFALVVPLFALSLKQNRAAIRCWLWTATSVKFLIPFALLMSIGSQFQWRTASPMSQPGMVSVMKGISVPFTPATTSPVRNVSPKPAAKTSRVPVVLASVWPFGCAVVLLAWLREWNRMRKIIKTASPLSLNIPIAVRSTPARVEPGVAGILRPVLLLPEGICDRLTEKQFESILAHELCHVRRRDNLAALVHMIVETIFWFHPLVWWIERRLMEERERACDEEVLRLTNDGQTYAEGILNVCKLYAETPVICMSGVSGANLRKRIETIMARPNLRELNFSRKALLVCRAIAALAGPITIGVRHSTALAAQAVQYTSGLTTVANRKFDVASVKENTAPPEMWQLNPPRNGGLMLTNMPLRKIIASSFRIQDTVVEGPSWIDSVRYDVAAKGPDPNAGYPEVWEMMRNMIADRFKLKYHIEERERPIFALTVAKGGHKLKKPEDGPCAKQIKAGEHCANLRFSAFNIGITNMPIQNLIGGLARIMPDRPIVDRTGLTGNYDLDVSWADESRPANGELRPGALDVAALITAFQEQAGLKLESARGPVLFLVIDHVEKASSN